MSGEKAQPLNVRPYSKTCTIFFIALHICALLFHTASFISGLALTPADVLVYPLAELTSTQTEIVGPCLGVSDKDISQCKTIYSTSILENLKITSPGANCAAGLAAKVQENGVDMATAQVELEETLTNGALTDLKFVSGKQGDALDCTKSYTVVFSGGADSACNPAATVECVTKYPFKIGNMVQPSCNINTIDSSCGVDERHREIKFSVDTGFNNKKQVFNQINIFGLFVWVDLISICFHVYAIFITYTSGYEDPFEAVLGLFSKQTSHRLEHPSEEMLKSPHYPRAPEYNRRWLDISLTYTIITLATALSLGITNFFQLVFLFLGVQIISFLGFLVDDFRYQLRITDADAWNRNKIYKKILEEQPTLADELDKQRPFNSGWTQPARNVIFCVGLQVLVWYFITFQFADAADNIIIQMGKEETDADALGNDAFVMLASVYRWLTGIIGFFQVLVLIGDMIADDRSRAHKDPPGNFLLDELDGDACFIVLMFTTKIVVTWFALATITEIYNVAGGVETRNGMESKSYLDKGLDGKGARNAIFVLGICSIGVFSLLIWLLTPSSLIYENYGKKLEKIVAKPCLGPKKEEEQEIAASGDATKENNGGEIIYRKKINF